MCLAHLHSVAFPLQQILLQHLLCPSHSRTQSCQGQRVIVGLGLTAMQCPPAPSPRPGTCPSFGLGALTPGHPSLHLLPCDPLWPLGGRHPLPVSPWDKPTPTGGLHRGIPQRGCPGAGLYIPKGTGWEQGYIPRGVAGSRVISPKGLGAGLYPKGAGRAQGYTRSQLCPSELSHMIHTLCVCN